MKIKNIAFISLLCAAAVFTGCTDYLTTESKNDITITSFYSTPKQIDQALIGVYGDLKPFAKYYWVMSELRSDNIFEIKESRTGDMAECSQFDATNLIDNSTVASCWSDHYALINAANVLLDNIDRVSFSSVAVRNQYEAECRFLRALSYFDLVRFFGNIPIATEPLTTTEALTTEQSTEADVYENVIVPDLQYAVANLADVATDYNNTEHAERASKLAAEALLVKVYMQMSGYPLMQTDKITSARTLLQDILSSANISAHFAPSADDWGNMFYSEGDNTYSIFEIQYACSKGVGNTASPMQYPSQTYGNDFVNAKTTSGAHCYIERQLANDFLAFPGDSMELDSDYVHESKFPVPLYKDKRAKYTVFIGSGLDEETGQYEPTGLPTTNNYASKFLEHAGRRSMVGLSSINDNIVDTSYWPQNFPVLRIEDMMLLYAEICGSTDAMSYEYVNMIRRRAGVATYSNLSESAFQEAVRQERRYEMLCEGQRWFDEVRQNTFVSDLKTMFNYYRDNYVSSESEKSDYTTIASRIAQHYYLYPIPLTEIQNTSGLYKQNDGY